MSVLECCRIVGSNKYLAESGWIIFSRTVWLTMDELHAFHLSLPSRMGLEKPSAYDSKTATPRFWKPRLSAEKVRKVGENISLFVRSHSSYERDERKKNALCFLERDIFLLANYNNYEQFHHTHTLSFFFPSLLHFIYLQLIPCINIDYYQSPITLINCN